eukprot:644608_1
MSSTLLTETKEDSSSTTPNINSTNDIQSTAEAKEAPTQPTPGAKQPTKKKKKKKNAILYQQTAVKYYNGFMKNKRYKKGIKLSTGCAIFKTAWELPESNGLILPSRVMRHFKQVLPKKPPPKTKKTKKKANADTIEDINPVQVIVDESSTSSQLPEDEPFVTRSRTIQNMHNPSTISPQLITAANNTTHQHEYNRTMLTLASTGKINTNTNTLSLINAQNLFCDQIEAMIDEQKFDEDTVKTKNKKHIISRSVDITQQMFEDDEHEIDPKPIEQDRNSSSIEEIPPHVYDDHAHIVQDDLKPDVEEQPTIQMRAQTIGVREIRAHVEMEEDEEPKKDINAATKPTNVYDDHAHIIEDDLKPDVEELPRMEVRAQTLNLRDHIHEDDHEEEEHKEAKKKKKKKKKKNPVLYAEVATKLYKKINDGKRFKKGITLKKACHIFSVAWELPEDNGRILPSKVARHFKQVLPSKKTAQKVAKAANIKPSVAKRNSGIHKPQTMRGHVKQHNWLGKKQNSLRRSMGELSVKKDIETLSPKGMKPKVSMISHLEDLMVLDPNRTRDEEHGNKKRVRAGTMTDIDLDIDIEDHEHAVVENEIEQLIEEKKKAKIRCEKENDAINAIDASFGL